MVNQSYIEFIERKSVVVPSVGMAKPARLPRALKPFQRAIVKWALRRGRAAMFEGTGLGKSLQQLAWARAVADHEAGRVLVLTPLAVADQTVGEAEKFGIKGVSYAADHAAVKTDIVISNYERFEKFDISQFAGIVLDECFAKGTPIVTTSGMINIEDVKPGMYIENAFGIDRVRAIAKREIKHAVKIKIGISDYISSDNHPWFTDRGWVAARDLRAGDFIATTDAAMLLVRDGVFAKGWAERQQKILQQELLSEMAHEHAGAQSESAYARNCCTARNIKIEMASANPRGESGSSQVHQVWSHTKGQKNTIGQFESDGSPTINQKGQWDWTDRTGTPNDDDFAARIYSRIGDITRSSAERISDLLQSRFWKSTDENSDRTGRPFSPLKEKAGCKERFETGFARVDSIEILELGHPELDRCRDADGKLYFYDIEAERHPSFSVDGLLVHNSGIIKSQDGKVRAMLTDACRHLRWRLCCTATPAPNDYTELGQHAEFLGIMTAKEMLSMFFVHDGSIRAGDDTAGSDGWRLKRHAESDFWRWLASWSVVVRHPRDLGFDDAGYDLPPMNLRETIVDAEYKPVAGQLFPFMASTLSERIGVRRNTAADRVAAAVEIVSREPDEPWLIWCNLNSEADAVEAALPRSLQVAGRHDVDLKVARLMGFKTGRPLHLVTKPSLAGHGMNYQNCARMIFVGLTDSFEQVYQAIRRCWRFGQTRPVDVWFVASELEGNVVANIRRKEIAFDRMLDAMSGHMRELMKEQVLGAKPRDLYNPTLTMELPTWM